MADIVNSLFGIDPTGLQQQRQMMDYNQAVKYAQLNPAEQAQFGAYLGGSQLGRAATQLMGGDEQLNKATQVRQLASQFDMTSADGLRQFAQAVSQFAPDVAQQAIRRSDEIVTTGLKQEKTRLDIGKTELDIKSTERKIAQDEKLRAELNAIPADATDEQILSVFRKYGNPDVVIRALESSSAKKAALVQKQTLLDLKNYEKAEGEKGKVAAATASADRIINTVDEAIPLVGITTAGVAGALNIPGTDGRNLEEALKTIKANLGFDRLQQMRDASKTGGALGQVAVKELEALQASIASLDRGQSPDTLRRNLEDIKFYYNRWSKAVKGEDPGPAVRPRTEQKQGAAGTMSSEDDALINRYLQPTAPTAK